MKYKVGDKVRIKSIDWYNKNKDEYGYVRCIDFLFTPEHSKYCGCEFTISHITEFQIPSYVMESNGHEWTDEMIEGLVEEENKPNIIEEAKTYWDSIKDAWICPEGYIFKDENGNVINATKIVLEKKKKEYPKTYEECCKIMDIDTGFLLTSYNLDFWKGHLLRSLQKLIICRNAYWKIAGEEMGLGKPWEPDGNPVYAITRNDGCIVEIETGGNDEVFEFPTKEMRDAFKENFDTDIEICKEFL